MTYASTFLPSQDYRVGVNKSFTMTRVGHNEVIGVCHTGPDAVGLGRDHWNEMLAYPRKPITHWHALGEVNTVFPPSLNTHIKPQAPFISSTP